MDNNETKKIYFAVVFKSLLTKEEIYGFGVLKGNEFKEWSTNKNIYFNPNGLFIPEDFLKENASLFAVRRIMLTPIMLMNEIKSFGNEKTREELLEIYINTINELVRETEKLVEKEHQIKSTNSAGHKKVKKKLDKYKKH